ncbi:MAG: hypothetical protein BJ554DRAFT_1797 [Olpidium bornovanus]|uniref:Uncharacterized protein n=1 Tax=Olpidium bornovanus TaxID=278681 RepID=A0A8H7ZS43_9FUNG|nr:MAG: hypothetical protein BJ554DRAFT_1797 [Olpidium bornovanus]
MGGEGRGEGPAAHKHTDRPACQGHARANGGIQIARVHPANATVALSEISKRKPTTSRFRISTEIRSSQKVGRSNPLHYFSVPVPPVRFTSRIGPPPPTTTTPDKGGGRLDGSTAAG